MVCEASPILSAGKLRVLLAPQVGGSIQNMLWDGPNGPVPVLRGPDGALESVLAAGSFPLVPYCNRIRGGAFQFRGREVRIAPNMAGDPSPLHGQGWLGAWDVIEAGARHATLRFTHEAGEWPWRYVAEQRFVLDEQGLHVELTCTNESADPMPCGLGQHPYFHCTAETVLDTVVATAWTIDEKVLPVEEVPASGRYDLSERQVCGQDLDNGFGGWGGSATVSAANAPFTIRMHSPDAGFFQLYSPAAGGIFVIEPVTHANAALNADEADWPRLGMRVLEPGETMRLNMRIDVTPV